MFTWYQKAMVDLEAVECSSFMGACCLSGCCCKSNC